MFMAGDEFLNTQRGNNNPYNQNNETTWLDWSLLEQNADIFRFFRLIIRFRKRHKLLGSNRVWRHSATWRGVGFEPDWSYHSHTLAFLIEDPDQAAIYVIVNAYSASLPFAPAGTPPTEANDRHRVAESLRHCRERRGLGGAQTQPLYLKAARSVVVLEAENYRSSKLNR
jgi:glycogen operon protein